MVELFILLSILCFVKSDFTEPRFPDEFRRRVEFVKYKQTLRKPISKLIQEGRLLASWNDLNHAVRSSYSSRGSCIKSAAKAVTSRSSSAISQFNAESLSSYKKDGAIIENNKLLKSNEVRILSRKRSACHIVSHVPHVAAHQGQEFVTVPSIGKQPLVIVLPLSCSPDDDKYGLTPANCQIKCTTECRMFAIDSLDIMECCPVDFEPRQPIDKNQDPCFEVSPTSAKPPSAIIYSSKWLGKRDSY